jgi:hypothetical protein
MKNSYCNSSQVCSGLPVAEKAVVLGGEAGRFCLDGENSAS